MEFLENVLLKDHTTFRVGGPARFFCRAESSNDVRQAIEFCRARKLPVFILGGGSNIVVDDEGFNGLVVKIEMRGVEYQDKGSYVDVIASAGEQWDELVQQAVARGLYGLENLSLIPGTVGAAPVQNIGAYGVEVKDSVLWVEAVDRMTGEIRVFSNEECQFAYRDSFFKHPEGKAYIITRVCFRLPKQGQLVTSYKDIARYFESRQHGELGLRDVRNAVIDIRTKKLPDLARFGTAGSFFKNVIVSESAYHDLKKRFPELPAFVVSEDSVKLPLAWILDNICDFKGYRNGEVGVYERQALVLINHGAASAREIKEFAEAMIRDVKEKTGIDIEPEVEYVDRK